ncbi:MAG: hypothetical protein BM564_10305 [Bacteroidetes bacterium MedPE-SWsnd-G2]|nr:MAG: hypothetical protein BM564_10305 [Bacteroidetes bacterium MedPE-SWsnd-G2]
MSLYKYVFILFFTFWCQGALSQNLKLKIYGANASETKIIDSIGYAKEAIDFITLQNNLNSFKTRLSQMGYIENEVTIPLHQENETFETTIALKTKYESVYIKTANTPTSQLPNEIIVSQTNDFIEIKMEHIEVALNQLNKALVKEGDPFSKIQLSNISKHSDYKLQAELTTTTIQKREIDSIIIKGYDKFPKSFIKHYLKIKKGNVLDLELIKEKTKNLENLRFSKQLKDPELLFLKDSTYLYIYVEKTKSNTFDGFLGFGTDETTDKIKFDGYLNLKLQNNLNFGETLSLLYKSDENEQRTFDVNVKLPFLFGTPINLDAGLNIFRKDSTFVTSKQDVELSYQINAKNNIGIGLKTITSSNLLDSDSSIALADYDSQFGTINFNHFKPQFNNTLFPVNFVFDLQFGFGKRNDSNGDLNQIISSINSFKIFNLNQKNSIFLRVQGALLNSDNFYDNELYRFGGINSIRGFKENSITGNLYGVLNTEYRYAFSPSMYIHTIFDAAYYENRLLSSEEKLFGFGLGFGFLTNAGLLKFNYASGKTEDSKFKFSESKIHLSLQANF